MSRNFGLGWFERLHGNHVKGARQRRLSDHLVRVIPLGASVLDVGCGDGALARAVVEERSDLSISGIDVLAWPRGNIPTITFDGSTIPFADASFDVVMLVDVLHHADDPRTLLGEAWRVARRALVIKDHLLQGFLAGTTLRFMDRFGNARYGVALPYNYWPPEKWRKAFAELGLTGDWRCSLNLYPWPASWIFDRSLHFLANLEPVSAEGGETCCDPTWEEAYTRFETLEEETRKFTKRLKFLGCAEWPRDAEVVELFCGRGSSLHALTDLGFHRVEGVDLSSSLARQYRGPAKIHVADCGRLPFEDGSKDVVIVQGGLHHLEELPTDLRRTLAESHRVLRDGGLFLAVEPWSTPFLRFVHLLCRSRLLCFLYPKLDALATMINIEAQTYIAWLDSPSVVLAEIEHFFEIDERSIGWGKLQLRGRRREAYAERRPDPSALS